MKHVRIIIGIISVIVFSQNLVGMEVHPSQGYDGKGLLSLLSNQDAFSKRFGKLAGILFQEKINRNWDYSTSTSRNPEDSYLVWLNTTSTYWDTFFDNILGIHLKAKKDIKASVALLDIPNRKTTIECERALGLCLSITLCQILGPDLFDVLYENPISRTNFYCSKLSPQQSFRLFVGDCCDNNFVMTNKIGHWGYIHNASLYDKINEFGFGIDGYGFGSDKGFHMIIVKQDEQGKGLYIGFSPELLKPIPADEVKAFMIGKLYDLMSKATQVNPSLYTMINNHYEQEFLKSNEDISNSSIILRRFIDKDYDKANIETNYDDRSYNGEISHYLDVNKLMSNTLTFSFAQFLNISSLILHKDC